MEQPALWEKLLNLLETAPTLPEYLAAEPESPTPFDPYQMVAEWIALRHEVKQQGKLLQTSHNSLQQAVEALQTNKAYLQQQLEDSRQLGMSAADQKALWRDLLTILDALDQACVHWQEQIDALAPSQSPPQAASAIQPWWRRWLQQLARIQPAQIGAEESTSLREVLISNQQGVDLIRRSLLELLRQQQIVPLPAQGHVFNPQTMYAVGRQETLSMPENLVFQEVVRGYLWREQVLREAQVIVAAKPESELTKDE